jgi:hypothetical protein
VRFRTLYGGPSTNIMTDNLPEPTSKDDFIKAIEDLNPSIMYPELWSDNQQKILDKQGKTSLRTKKMLFANIPMVCKGNDCPIKQDCPLFEVNEHPYGKKCPIEFNLIQDLLVSYMQELGVDHDNLLELAQVKQLISQEIQLLRIGGALAQEGFITENVIGVDDVGNPIVRKELALPVEYEDKVLKRLKAGRDELIASRQAKVKAGQVQKDAMLALAETIHELEEVDKARERKRRKKLDIIDVEPYDDEE